MILKNGTFRARSIKVAEAAKISENVQRDLNISLMNELSLIYSKLGLRSNLYNNKMGLGISIENIVYILNSYTQFNETIPILFTIWGYYKLRYLPLTIRPKNFF